MKSLNILFLLLPLVAAGCIRENLNGCITDPELAGNTVIRFDLRDREDNDIFQATVGSVELFVYNADGGLVHRSTTGREQLTRFAGRRLQLNPGIYTVVVWANATAERTQFFADHLTFGGDPLYYAPKDRTTPLTVEVPTTGSVEVTALLRHAHVKMDITVEGYDHVPVRAAAEPLTITLTDIRSRYDFRMSAHGDLVNLTAHAPNTDYENKVFGTSFNVPVFDRTTTTHIRIINNRGRLIMPAISLAELLGDKIDLDELQHLPIHIKFTWDDGYISAVVTVDLPQWGEDNIEPNI